MTKVGIASGWQRLFNLLAFQFYFPSFSSSLLLSIPTPQQIPLALPLQTNQKVLNYPLLHFYTLALGHSEQVTT